MIVKCGRREFRLDESDEIMYNGASYIILTKSYSDGFGKYSPKIAKARARKMIKNGEMVFKEKRKGDFTNSIYDIYKVVL